jgi:hypothetical protein
MISLSNSRLFLHKKGLKCSNRLLFILIWRWIHLRYFIECRRFLRAFTDIMEWSFFFDFRLSIGQQLFIIANHNDQFWMLINMTRPLMRLVLHHHQIHVIFSLDLLRKLVGIVKLLFIEWVAARVRMVDGWSGLAIKDNTVPYLKFRLNERKRSIFCIKGWFYPLEGWIDIWILNPWKNVLYTSL